MSWFVPWVCVCVCGAAKPANACIPYICVLILEFISVSSKQFWVIITYCCVCVCVCVCVFVWISLKYLPLVEGSVTTTMSCVTQPWLWCCVVGVMHLNTTPHHLASGQCGVVCGCNTVHLYLVSPGWVGSCFSSLSLNSLIWNINNTKIMVSCLYLNLYWNITKIWN